jgi:hypothetical protein
MSLEGGDESSIIFAPDFNFAVFASCEDEFLCVIKDEVVDGAVLLLVLCEEGVAPKGF